MDMQLRAMTWHGHAQQLAKAFDIRWIPSELLKPDEALAIVQIRVVLSRPIVDETSYAAVLHEFGHLAHPNGVIPGPQIPSIKRIQEDAAWEWARSFALEWTPVMEAVAKMCEATYANIPDPPINHDPRPAPVVPPKPEPYKATPSINWEDWK